MTLFGYPLTELFLYFMLYSFLGWLMETCYCSICEKRLVPRGFLYGPICPIYGAGVLLMILFFTPLKGNLVLFYLVAVVVMSGWEYFVGWLLEVTTHVKYWDYSHFRFNIKGRICLWVALVWGILSYIVVFWIHPPVEALYARIPLWLVYTLCSVLLVILVVDAVLTIRHLALISRFVTSVTTLREEMQLQLSLGKAELEDLLEAQSAAFKDKYDEKAAALRQKYHDQIVYLEKYSRRFRNHYSNMKAVSRYTVRSEDIRAAAELAKEEIQKKKAAARAARQARKEKH